MKYLIGFFVGVLSVLGITAVAQDGACMRTYPPCSVVDRLVSLENRVSALERRK